MAFLNLAYAKRILAENRLVFVFVSSHTLLAVFLGRQYAFAPDEGGYLYAFNNIYTTNLALNPQYSSGWINTPKLFLWIAYFPAKILSLIGVPDYLSIRLLSILLAATSLYLLKQILNQSGFNRKISQKIIFLFFFIPSIFLWSSLGIRESFIFAELTAFLAGFNFLVQGKNRKALILLLVGSYGLLSTKNYLWVCLMFSVVTSCCFFAFNPNNRRVIAKFLIASFLLPVAAFASTSSLYSLVGIAKSNVVDVGKRYSDSIISPEIESNSAVGRNLAYSKNFTLNTLYLEMKRNPNSTFSRAMNKLGISELIEDNRNQTVESALGNVKSASGAESSLSKGMKLSAGKISDPISIIRPAAVFLFGPFSFNGDSEIFLSIASLEAPLWWSLYTLVILQFLRFRQVKLLRDPQILLTLIFLAGEIIMSALIEVNLGTSFRHRSIILVPLVFLYVRLAQSAKEQKE
jgi:hypothetical protein